VEITFLGQAACLLRRGTEVFSAIPGLIRHTLPRGSLFPAMKMWTWRKSRTLRISMSRTCIMIISIRNSFLSMFGKMPPCFYQITR